MADSDLGRRGARIFFPMDGGRTVKLRRRWKNIIQNLSSTHQSLSLKISVILIFNWFLMKNWSIKFEHGPGGFLFVSASADLTHK